MRESDLYKPVARLLERRYGCARKYTWIAGCGKDLSFPAGFGNRKPDVVGCKVGPLKREVHLAEGKLRNLPTHGFEETLNQLDNLRPYSDFLWAVFPLDSWTAAGANHDRWIPQLRQRGYGLLLVSIGRANAQFEAQPNSVIDPKLKKSLLAALLGDSDEPVVIPTLATETAENSIRAASRVAEIMVGPARDLFGKSRSERSFTVAVTSPGVRFFLIGDVWSGKMSIQGDPFSTYLNDGRALIWVWRFCGNLGKDEKSIRAIISRKHPPDVYFYSDNDRWEWICRPLSEVSLDRLKAAGYLGEFSLGRAIPISDRSLAGLRSDIRRMLAWAARERW